MRIAHLSDPHITTGPLAAGPAQGLYQALGRALSLEPRPDCVVITGDLTDRGEPEEYAALHAILRRCPVPVLLVAGNHDDPGALTAEFGVTPFLAGGTSLRYAADLPGATVVVTDSHVDGTPGGTLGPSQLTWIDETLRARPDVPALVCVHHPPRPLGLPFLDGMRLEDGPALAEVIARHPCVVRVLAGHVHRTILASFAGTTVAVAPSTYRLTALRMHDAEPPGYLAEPPGFLLHLVDESGCVTHAVNVGQASAAFAL
jgi:3',5'-cyclic AMP phosphodiesterase CpdA